MRTWWALPAIVLSVAVAVQAQDGCLELLQGMELPKRVKTRGKPKFMKWEDIDKALNEAAERLKGSDCSLRFEQIFAVKEKEEVWFPLTNSVVRLVPEESLVGLPVFTRGGDELGRYESRIRYERAGDLYASKSYTLYYFQYRSSDGKLHAVGERLLLDEFGVPWSQLKSRVALQPEEGER
ncbi:MAG TPA: hypothetical protein P5300_09480 [Acidobacteriota bacterium]|nr:hypothetical protein [Acidobacteriota bacterium]